MAPTPSIFSVSGTQNKLPRPGRDGLPQRHRSRRRSSSRRRATTVRTANTVAHVGPWLTTDRVRHRRPRGRRRRPHGRATAAVYSGFSGNLLRRHDRQPWCCRAPSTPSAGPAASATTCLANSLDAARRCRQDRRLRPPGHQLDRQPAGRQRRGQARRRHRHGAAESGHPTPVADAHTLPTVQLSNT